MKKTASVLLILFLIILQISTISEKTIGAEKITDNELTLTVGQISNLQLPEMQGISNEKWYSSNKKIAMVNKSGQVTAISIGKVKVSCAYNHNNKKCNRVWAVTVENVPEPFRCKLVAHALGGLENKYIYNNALEGLEQSTQNGFKFMETDVILTADDKVVCSHGWSKQSYEDTGVPYNADNPVMTYDQFMNTKIQGKYTTIDLSTIVQYMKQHKDVYFEFDLRTIDRVTAAKTTEKIVQAFDNNKELLDRVLMQAGSDEMYEGIDSVYHFKYYQRFVHNKEIKHINKIIDWCKKNKIASIAVYKEHLTNEIIKDAKQNGICILTHTVDDPAEAQQLLNSGVDLICTNFITYAGLSSAK